MKTMAKRGALQKVLLGSASIIAFSAMIGVVDTARAAEFQSGAIEAGETLTLESSSGNGSLVVSGNVDDGNGGTGGTAIVRGADATEGTSGVTGTVSIAGTTNLTALTYEGGTGAAGSGFVAGGDGGTISEVTHVGAVNLTTLNLKGGAGAAGANDNTVAGGNGGDITTIDFQGLVTATTTNITSGDGGMGGSNSRRDIDETPTSFSGGNGGNGGAVKADFSGGLSGALNITSGNGAAGRESSAVAGGSAVVGTSGNGGAVTLTDIASAGTLGSVTVVGGAGGAGGNRGNGDNTNSTDQGANGGAGGAGGNITITDISADMTSLTITAGAGGQGGGQGTGVAIEAGAGGAGASVDATVSGAISGDVSLTAGAGGNGGDAGNANGAGGNGGAGGDVTISFENNIGGALAFDDGAPGVAGQQGNGTAIPGSLGTGGTVTATFSGTSAQTVSGAVSAASNREGSISVTNTGGLVSFASAVGTSDKSLKSISLATGTKTSFGGNVYAGALSLAGTADVTISNTIALGGALTTMNGNTLTLSSHFVNGTTVFTSSGSDVTLDQTAGAVTITSDIAFASGTITLVDDTNILGSADAASFTVKDTALVDYSTIISDGNIIITAKVKDSATIASDVGLDAQQSNAFRNAGIAAESGDDGARAALNKVLNTGGAGVKKAAEQIGVQSDTLGANSQVAVGTGTKVFGVMSSRLSAMRTGNQYADAQTGFAAGDGALANAVWLKPFGNWSNQDAKGGIDGYDAKTYGISGGFDGEIAEGVRLGSSIAYANTSVDGDGAGSSKTDIDSYQLSVYGDYTADAYYVEGMVGYARNKNDTSRHISFGGLNRTASGDYDSNQYMASIGAGMPFNIGGNAFLTPTVGLSYTHVTSDSYTETGAGNFNMTVNPDDVDAVIGAIGARVHTRIAMGTGTFIPEFRVGVSYDFAGDEATATGTYTGGGAAFAAEGTKVEQLGGNAGLGLTYDDGAWSVGANVEAEVKNGFLGKSASLEARFKF